MDEALDEHPAKYFAQEAGLSGGWRGFKIDDELIDGDALVFQLVSPTTFKVILGSYGYIRFTCVNY